MALISLRAKARGFQWPRSTYLSCTMGSDLTSSFSASHQLLWLQELSYSSYQQQASTPRQPPRLLSLLPRMLFPQLSARGAPSSPSGLDSNVSSKVLPCPLSKTANCSLPCTALSHLPQPPFSPEHPCGTVHFPSLLSEGKTIEECKFPEDKRCFKNKIDKLPAFISYTLW